MEKNQIVMFLEQYKNIIENIIRKSPEYVAGIKNGIDYAILLLEQKESDKKC